MEIYINNTLVDYKDDLPLSFNFSIADIRNPDKRNTAYSKTIKLPGSKTNNALFSYIFDISKESLSTGGTTNFTPDFNANLKAVCRVYSDSLLQMVGFVQLLKINKNENEIEYEVSVFGNLANLFASVGSLNLTDIDLSIYDHVFSKANQKNSWATKIKKNGADFVNFSGGHPTGEGYIYPLIDYGYGQSKVEFDVLHLYPAIYLKTYIDYIFAIAGFTYTSLFFQSTLFKSLIIPFNGETIGVSDADLLRRRFEANTPHSPTTNFTFVTINHTTVIRFLYPVLAFDNEITDPLSQFDGSAFTVKKLGRYTLSLSINLDYYISADAASVALFSVQSLSSMCKNDLVFDIVNVNSGLTVASKTISIGSWTGGTIGGAPNISTLTDSVSINNTEFQIGQQYFIKVRLVTSINTVDPNRPLPTYEVNIVLNSTTDFKLIPINTPIVENNDMFINSCIPKDIPIKDFFLSIVRMFNLYINPDQDNEKNLMIEPQVDFYSGNSVVDWTQKLDTSLPIEIRPASEIEGKDYKFSYKEDSDFFNADYSSKYGGVYGDRDIIVNNDFVTGTKELGLIFSATPSEGNSINDLVIPRLLKGESDGSVSPQSVNIRILYYGGVLPVGGTWKYTSTTGNTNESTYPYAGHLDNPYTPTFDLLFDVPKSIYWNAGNIAANYTNNNLYNKYYKQFIEEITDKDSKLVRAYFRLRPSDIFLLDFKNFIHVDGINYRLNSIIDYDATKDGVTWVELSKIKRGVAFTSSVIDIKTQDQLFNILQGGQDEIRSLRATSPIYIVEGGIDQVIGMTGISPVQIVNGGRN